MAYPTLSEYKLVSVLLFFTGSQILPFYNTDVRGAICNSIFAWTIEHLKQQRLQGLETRSSKLHHKSINQFYKSQVQRMFVIKT
jgi:hypothetical protein